MPIIIENNAYWEQWILELDHSIDCVSIKSEAVHSTVCISVYPCHGISLLIKLHPKFIPPMFAAPSRHQHFLQPGQSFSSLLCSLVYNRAWYIIELQTKVREDYANFTITKCPLVLTPCLASPQPQVSCPRAGSPPPSLIHMVELGFVGLLNNPKRIFAQVQKLEVKLART